MSQLKLHAEKISGGNALPLIVLHGWRQDRNSLRGVAEFLQEGREVHLIDLPGFGESEAPPNAWGTPEYAARLLAYLDEQKIDRADFLGHSYGGRISMYLAFTTPARVSRLVLIDASGVRAKPPLRRQLKILAVKTTRNVLRFCKQKFGLKLYETWFIPRFASADYKASGTMREVFVRIVNEEFSEEVKLIKAPTLILWGELDTETPVAVAHKLHSLIPGSSLVVLPGKDHFPFLGSGASLCAYHVKNFFAESTPGAQA